MNFKILDEIKDTNLIELYNKDNSESFSLGYIIKKFDDYILFLAINEYGALEGYQLWHKKYIAKIIKDSEYIDMYTYFIEYNKKVGIFDVYSLNELLVDFNSFNDLLSDCFYKKVNISIISNSSEQIILGKIISMNQENILMRDKHLGYKIEDQEITISKENILVVEFIGIENFLLTKYEESKA